MTTNGPPAPSEKRKRPEDDANDAASGAQSPDSPGKRRRTIGPTLPPARLEERPATDPAEEDGQSSSDDDGFGPSLPPTTSTSARQAGNELFSIDNAVTSSEPDPSSQRTERDEWMLVPPSQDDLSSRFDPTQLRNRKFNTGRGAKAPAAKGGDNAIWTETPEQKRLRLENQVLGIKEPTAPSAEDGSRGEKGSAEEEARLRKIREFNEKARGATLYDEHKKSTTKEKDDDPSTRPFDREKDIGGGTKINHAKRKEMLNRAADFGSRFTSGKYL